ncbi:hypothetical protein ACFX15_039754 [Malus domestica]
MACTIDFRRLDEGFGGKTYKRKRNPQSADEDASIFGGAAMDIDDSYPPPAKRSAVPSSDNPEFCIDELVMDIDQADQHGFLDCGVSTRLVDAFIRPATEAASVVAFVASIATWFRDCSQRWHDMVS